MRRYPLILSSLGVLSFTATLGVLHVTRGPLFGPRLQSAMYEPVFVGPVAVEHAPDNGVVGWTPTATGTTATNAVTAPVATAAALPAAAPPLPEPARAELVTLRAQIENQGDVRDRMTAVNALRRIGMGGDPDGYVRASLRVAMNDPNPNVKSIAEQAYELVAAQYGEPQ